jgi:hypothetical protein
MECAQVASLYKQLQDAEVEVQSAQKVFLTKTLLVHVDKHILLAVVQALVME